MGCHFDSSFGTKTILKVVYPLFFLSPSLLFLSSRLYFSVLSYIFMGTTTAMKMMMMMMMWCRVLGFWSIVSKKKKKK
jgi:hypothetical protein